MNNADFTAIVEKTIKATAELLVKKGDEYAGDADRLANFKRNADKQGITVLECWKTYYSKHADSIDTYFARVRDESLGRALLVVFKQAQGGIVTTAPEFRGMVERELPWAVEAVNKQLSEPIESRFYDVINYTILCMGLLQELRQEVEGDRRADA